MNNHPDAIVRLVEQTVASASTLFQLSEGDLDERRKLALNVLDALTKTQREVRMQLICTRIEASRFT